MKSLFKSEQGKQKIFSLYDRKLKEQNIEVESTRVSTSFGETHILMSGDPSNPPIFIIHGSNGCAPLAFETYPSLHKSFRVFAIDVLAQPNKSAETRLSMKDLSYGKWINEIIDHFQLEKVTLAGFSFGGLVILKTLEYKEDKIKEVFLSAPAYIVNGNPIKALFKVFRPMKRYMKTHNVGYVEKFLADVFTERDQFAIDYLSEVFLHFEMDFTPVPTIKKSAARNISTPISIFAGDEDIIFPGKKMLKRAAKIFPSIKQAHLIKNSKHVQSKNQNALIEHLILDMIN